MNRSFMWCSTTVLSLSLVLSGCGDDPKPVAKKAPPTTIARATTTLNPRFTGEFIDATEHLADLSRIVGQPLHLTSVLVSTDRIQIIAQAFDNPDNFNSFAWSPIRPIVKPPIVSPKKKKKNQATTLPPPTTVKPPALPGDPERKGWGASRPVSLSVVQIARLKQQMFSVSDVNWAGIPKVGKFAITKFAAELESPSISAVSLSRSSIGIVYTVSVSGTRGHAFVRADAQGNVTASGRS